MRMWNASNWLREAYDAGSTRLVSSHNDPVPSNILFDGERLWLIDWESACRNDPLVDVAIVLDHLARSPELEDVLLQGLARPRAGRGAFAPGSSWSARSPAFTMRASCSARLQRHRG